MVQPPVRAGRYAGRLRPGTNRDRQAFKLRQYGRV